MSKKKAWAVKHEIDDDSAMRPVVLTGPVTIGGQDYQARKQITVNKALRAKLAALNLINTTEPSEIQNDQP